MFLSDVSLILIPPPIEMNIKEAINNDLMPMFFEFL
jgi:hypothetical protein